MKNIISRFSLLLIVLLLNVPSALAQKMTVESFGIAPNGDISASAYSRLDLNGNRCALVKVGLALQGAKFEGGIMGDVVYKTGEYWVYMPKGNRVLQIKHDNYLPLMVEFGQYGIEKLEGNTTYKLTILLPQGSTINQPVDAGGNFYAISVTPKNAVVRIDDNDLAVSADGEYMAMLPYGEHTYMVKSEGYVPQNGSFTISKNDTPPINIELQSAMASVSVTCPTPAVSLYVDKKLVGTGSWSGNLKEGMHLIEAKKDGYRGTQKTIQLSQQQKLNVTLDALTAIVGNLSVTYKPIGADIYLDGEKVGQSPKVINGLLVGNHKLEVRKSGYTSETKNITIAENQTANVSGSLVPTTSTSTSSSNSNSSNYSSSGTSGIHRGHEWVDLGLPSGTKWATTNIGATSPSDYGNYYAWGETTTKSRYDWSNLKYCLDNYGNKFSKYVTDKRYGKVDGKKELDLSDDAAFVNWGEGWLIPSRAQQDELREKCKWKWTSMGGHKGYKVVGPNGESLFLPAAGYRDGSISTNVGSYGYCWSRSLDTSNGDRAFGFTFDSGCVDWGNYNLRLGFTVRPVLAP